MKRLLLLILVMTSLVIVACAEEIDSGDWRYEVLDNGTARITKYLSPTAPEDFVIPGEIDGLTVTQVGACDERTGRALQSVRQAIFLYWDAGQCVRRITLPDSVTLIGAGAFSGTPFTEIALPAGLTVLGESAFSSCDQLKEVTIPARLTAIGENVFYLCAGLERVVFAEGAPAVGKGMFKHCESLTEVVLPASIAYVRNQAFEHSGLKQFIAPEGLQQIGDKAFSNCARLTDVQLREGVRIGNYAFSTIGARLIDLPAGVLLDDVHSAWYEEAAEGDWRYGAHADGTAVILGYDGKKTTLVVPAEIAGHRVVAIGRQAFRQSKATKITLPDTLEEIGTYAFDDCSKLTSIALPEGLRIIRNGAFNAAGLTKVTLPESVCYLGRNAFEHCKKLTQATLPDTLDSVPPYCFYGCGSLNKVHMPASAKVIGQAAFEHCKALTTVDLPQGLERIEEDAFMQAGMTSVTLPESLRFVGQLALKTGNGAQKLRSLTWYALDCQIHDEAFGQGYATRIYASDLADITVRCHPGSDVDTTLKYNVKKVYPEYRQLTAPSDRVLTAEALAAFLPAQTHCVLVVPDGVEEIASDLLKFNPYVHGIILPDSVTTLGERAFCEATGLTSATLGKGITALPKSCFANARSLSSVKLPAGLTVIGESAFALCEDLAKITLPATLTTIGDSAFLGAGLTSVTLPDSLTSLGVGAFSTRIRLTKVTFGKGLTEIPQQAFFTCNLTSVTVPKGVTHIAELAFAHNFECKTITLPKGLVTIGDMAFLMYAKNAIGYPIFNEALTTLTIPEGVVSIGDRAFSGFAKMTSVKLNKGLVTIGPAAFNGTGLKSIHVPKGVASIGEDAFMTTSIASVNLPDTLTAIGPKAFDNMASKVTVTCPKDSFAWNHVQQTYPDYKLKKPGN